MDGIRERKQGGNAYKNKNRAGVEMLEARVGGKGKAVENENVLDGYIGKQKDRKMMGRKERERGRGCFFYGSRLSCLCGWISSLSPSVSMAAPSCQD